MCTSIETMAGFCHHKAVLLEFQNIQVLGIPGFCNPDAGELALGSGLFVFG